MSELETTNGVREQEETDLQPSGSEVSDANKDRKARFKALQNRAVKMPMLRLSHIY